MVFHFAEKQRTYEAAEPYYNRNADLKNALDLSMACSDSKIYTTWSNLKHSSMNKIITRHPSGNNNTIPEFSQEVENVISIRNKRSQSLPDLTRATQLQHLHMPLNFSVSFKVNFLSKYRMKFINKLKLFLIFVHRLILRNRIIMHSIVRDL